MHVGSQPELPHAVLVELQRLIDAALCSRVSSTHGRYGDAQTGDQSKGSVRGGRQRKALAGRDAIGSGGTTGTAEVIGNDAIETEVRDEQDPR